MVSLVSIKGLGTWIGATPELLLSVTDDLLMTVALAGTRVQNSPQWGEKESEEQFREEEAYNKQLRIRMARDLIDDTQAERS